MKLDSLRKMDQCQENRFFMSYFSQLFGFSLKISKRNLKLVFHSLDHALIKPEKQAQRKAQKKEATRLEPNKLETILRWSLGSSLRPKCVLKRRLWCKGGINACKDDGQSLKQQQRKSGDQGKLELAE